MSDKEIDFKVEDHDVKFWSTVSNDLATEIQNLEDRLKFSKVCLVAANKELRKAEQKAGK